MKLSLVSCSSAELTSVSFHPCKIQTQKLYLQLVKKSNHLPCNNTTEGNMENYNQSLRFILIYFFVIAITASCSKNKSYICTENCGNLTFTGTITNFTDNSYDGVSNRTLTLKLHKGKNVYTLGNTTSNNFGVFSLTILIDTTIFNARRSYLDVDYANENPDEFYWTSNMNNSSSFQSYPLNDTIQYNMSVLELTEVEITLKRTGIDSFLNAEMGPTVWAYKLVSGNYEKIPYATIIPDKKLLYRTFSNQLFGFRIIKHSGIWDTIPGTNGMGKYEKDNIFVHDSIFSTPKTFNQLTINY